MTLVQSSHSLSVDIDPKQLILDSPSVKVSENKILLFSSKEDFIVHEEAENSIVIRQNIGPFRSTMIYCKIITLGPKIDGKQHFQLRFGIFNYPIIFLLLFFILMEFHLFVRSEVKANNAFDEPAFQAVFVSMLILFIAMLFFDYKRIRKFVFKQLGLMEGTK